MSKITPFQIEIPSRNALCSHGKERFSPEMEYYSIILEEEGHYQRHDYCLACWELGDKKQLFPDSKGAWRSKVAKSEKVNREEQFKNRDEKILAYLRKLIKEDECPEEAFILALYLARKKILFLRQEIAGAEENVQIYEFPDL